jgi:hypothetical protein
VQLRGDFTEKIAGKVGPIIPFLCALDGAVPFDGNAIAFAE